MAEPRNDLYAGLKVKEARPIGRSPTHKPAVEAAAWPLEERPVAVFVAHGMGQQIRFATLDRVADGLRRVDAARRGVEVDALPDPSVVEVQADGQRLHRVELQLLGSQGERQVHLYEGYWAPFTEGVVNLRNVLAFLFRGGWHGLGRGLRPFRRFLFGKVREFPAQASIILYLLVTLAIVASLVVINSVVALVAAARAPFVHDQVPAWLSNGLFADLTTVLNVLLATFLAFGLVLGSSIQTRRSALNRWFKWPQLASLGLAALATIGAAVTAPVLLFVHSRSPQGAAFLPNMLGSWVDRLNYWLPRVLGGGLGLAVLVWSLWKLCRFLPLVWRANPRTRLRNLVLTMLSIAVVLAAGVWIYLLLDHNGQDHAKAAVGWLAGISWPLLVLVSGKVRGVLVSYIGDVAAYVDAHVLDRFSEVREKIRNQVLNDLRSVYEANGSGTRFYDGVAVVGHSLGSVVVYDALNRLLANDALASPTADLDVAGRTRLLLTFGSPLDKTAFLFGLQAEGMDLAREGLAASAQPMLTDPKNRPFPWVNIWAPQDVISGALDLYDLPPGVLEAAPQRVENVVDLEATTLLAAHNEYWDNDLLFTRLRNGLIG